MPESRPVALFCSGLAGDGVARNTIHLARALARRATPVEVICLRGGALAADLGSIPVTYLGWGRAPRQLALAAAAPALRRRLRTLDPSLVVSMGNHAHLTVWSALRGRPDIPRIYRVSNDPAHGGCNEGVLRTLRLGLIAADATRLLCVSAGVSAGKPFRRARQEDRLDVLPNGVDVEAVRARARERVDHPWIADGRPYLVAVGRLHPQKNYETLVEALAVARDAHGLAPRLLVLGAAPAKHRAALEARAAALGLNGAVRFEGEVANPFPYLAGATAYVLPSLWEGASNSLLEALACDLPVVAARSAGNACEVLAGGRYGALADGRDPRDLAGAIARQLDPETRVRPSGRAEAFRLDAMLDRFCAIVAGVRAQHDEIQMLSGPAGHRGSLSRPSLETHTEY